MSKSEAFKLKLREIFNNKTILACALLTIIYLASGYWKWFELGVTICAFIFFIIFPLQNSFCIFMYLHCFFLSNIAYNSCFSITICLYFIVLLVKYCIGVKRGKFPVYKALLISIITFTLYGIFVGLFYKFWAGGFFYIIYLPLFYLIFAMRKELDIAQGMNYLAMGLFVSCGLSLLTIILPKYGYYLLSTGENRLRCFTNHPNSLYIRALFVLSYYMYRCLANKLSFLKFTIIYLTCGLLTVGTKSKTGMLLFALFTLLFLILCLITDFKKKGKYVGIFVIMIAIACIVMHKQIAGILDRFTIYDGRILHSLTTGRDDIWKGYFYEIFKSPVSFIFGHGLLAPEVYISSQSVARSSHSLYLFLLYRFGLVGCLLLGYIVYLFVKPQTKPQFIASIPLIWILLDSFTVNTFKPYNFTLFLFAFMILFDSSKNKSVGNLDGQINEKVVALGDNNQIQKKNKRS